MLTIFFFFATSLVIHNTFFNSIKGIRKVQMLSTEFLVNIERFHARG